MRLLLTFIFLFILTFPAFAEDFVIVANREGPLKTAEVGMVKDIYLGEIRFVNNVKLKPINLTEGEVKNDFLLTVVGVSAKEYKLHWIKKVFQEGLTLPRFLRSVDEVLAHVRSEKGALAYIPMSEVSKIKKDGQVVILQR
ncbi:MAG: hypothetical protein KAT46_02500 [Deltaproteobacteria bacterium]|nr:hypothetical protein [Deltaproteobacteria bacterium]